MEKKLCRSKKDKKIAGVCGGFAEYFNVDATLIRVILVVCCLCFGVGILAYIIAMLIMPEASEESSSAQAKKEEIIDENNTATAEKSEEESFESCKKF